MIAKGKVHKYMDNVDTDVIIPARYLNSSVPSELAEHCMEDIDADFTKNVKDGDIMVAHNNFGCGSSMLRLRLRRREFRASSRLRLQEFFTGTPST